MGVIGRMGRKSALFKTYRNKRLKCSRNYVWMSFLMPSFLGVTLFLVVPYMDVIKRSFQTAVTEEWSGILNYIAVFNNQAFRLAAWNSVRFAAVCLPLLIGLGLLAAIAFHSLPVLRGVRTLYLLPMAVPSATVVLVWKLVFDRNGFLNGLFGSHIDFMDTHAAFGVLVFSYIWKNLGYTIVLWMTGLAAIPEEIREAARMDGAGERQVFWRVCAPQLLPTLFTIMVLSFLNSFKVFREAYLVSGSYPHDSIYMLQHLFNNWFTNMELDKMAAGAVITGGVIMSGILILQKLWED